MDEDGSLTTRVSRFGTSVRPLLVILLAQILAGCSTPPVAHLPSPQTNSIVLSGTPTSSNPPISGSLTPLTYPTNQPDWSKVAEEFYRKFHDLKKDESFMAALSEKIGDKVVDKGIEKGIDALQKKLFGGEELKAIAACCGQINKATETLANLQSSVQQGHSTQLQRLDAKLVALTNLAAVAIGGSVAASGALYKISQTLYAIIVLAFLLTTTSVIRLIRSFQDRNSGTQRGSGHASTS